MFESVWMNDHLTDIGQDRAGTSWEAVTAMAALAHHVPGRWLGHAVLSATFRHPAVTAKAATVLDHVTGGRFILGLGAGWFEPEHVPFGIPFPPMPERFDRFESAVRTIRALFSAEAATPAGVTRDDPFVPLVGATNDPPTVRAGGPPIWLGGQKRRGIALAAELADGWLLPAVLPDKSETNIAYFHDRRDALLASDGRRSAAIRRVRPGRPGTGGHDRRPPTACARDGPGRPTGGATHVIVGIPPAAGPAPWTTPRATSPSPCATRADGRRRVAGTHSDGRPMRHRSADGIMDA